MESMHRVRWVALSLVATLGSGCGWADLEGNGVFVTVQRDASDFVALQLSDGIESVVVVDPTQPAKVVLVGDENLVDRLRTDSSGGGTLSIQFPDSEVSGWHSSNPLRAEVTVPRLESLSRSGGGSVDLSGTISASTFLLNVSGGGAVKARGFATQELHIDASGGSAVTLAGYSDQVTTDLSGGSIVFARDFSARDASLSISGGGVAVMGVSDTLRVSASGGSTAHIIGQPSVLSRNLSGGSALEFE